MPRINGVQPGAKPIETEKTEESAAPAKAESSAVKEAGKDQFEAPKQANVFDNFASGPAAASKLPPGEAMTAKGKAYLKWKEHQSHAPGEARTAKGEAYVKWKETHNEETGKALTAKGHAYQKMMKDEANEILRQQGAEKPQPGEAPRAKKQSSQ